MRKTVRINGMHCDACVRRVTLALGRLPGAEVEEVQVGSAKVNTTASDAQVISAVEGAGFQATVEPVEA